MIDRRHTAHINFINNLPNNKTDLSTILSQVHYKVTIRPTQYSVKLNFLFCFTHSKSN